MDKTYFWRLNPIKQISYMHHEVTTEYSFLQRLLLSPQFRFHRYLLLFIMMITISLNQTFVYFQHETLFTGKYVYFIAGVYLVTYLCTVYFHIYYLLPKYFLKRKYGKFFFGFLFSIFLIALIQALCEILVKKSIGESGFPIDLPWVIEFFSNYLLISLCFSGINFTILLRHWLTDNQRISLMEKEQLRSEMEQLKEQVSPILLFNTLNRAGVLAVKEPENASAMLLKLSQLLRYQLYDCNREKVLLSSEITFLTNYLTLEQMHSDKFTYEILSEGQANHSLVAPLLFIPFVQAMVHKIYLQENKANLIISFTISNEEIIFSCLSDMDTKIESHEWIQAQKRLNLLYPDKYSICIEEGKTELIIKQGK